MARPQKRINLKQGWLSRLWGQTKRNTTWYCNSTSLHGFQYISSIHSSIFTRLLFACAICCSVVLCCYLITLQLLEHESQSILTTVTSTAYPVWKVSFPAVTVCNFNVVYKDNIMNLMKVVKSRGIKEEIFMDLVSNLSALVTNGDLGEMNGYQEAFDALEESGYTVDRLMAELAHPCDNMIKKCIWQFEEIHCSYMFDSIITSHGYCCSFNYYGTQNTAHKIHDPQTFRYQYVAGAGPTLGLRLVLDVDEKQYVSSIRPSAGLHILVQDGIHYPDMDFIANTVQPAEEVTISVTPRIYISSNNLRSMRFERRQCLFEDERNSEWGSIYSYKTCLIECRVKAIFQYCRCVPYYYPIQSRKRICTLLDVPCLQTNKYEYNELGISDDFIAADEIQPMHDRIEKGVQCSCYPQCNEKFFDFHTDRARASRLAGFEYANISVLNVYYSSVGCIKTDRDVYYTWDRVFASIGGIFGLCLGGSIISILEYFYFMGKCVPNCKKTEANAVKPKDGMHASKLGYHGYKNNFGNKPFIHTKTQIIAGDF